MLFVKKCNSLKYSTLAASRIGQAIGGDLLELDFDPRSSPISSACWPKLSSTQQISLNLEIRAFAISTSLFSASAYFKTQLSPIESSLFAFQESLLNTLLSFSLLSSVDYQSLRAQSQEDDLTLIFMNENKEAKRFFLENRNQTYGTLLISTGLMSQNPKPPDALRQISEALIQFAFPIISIENPKGRPTVEEIELAISKGPMATSLSLLSLMPLFSAVLETGKNLVDREYQ